MAKAGLHPSSTVMVGDTVWDVEAAARAGIPCIGVLSGGVARAVLSEAGAVEVYDDVAQLLERIDDSLIGHLLRTGRLS
jgi:phosphoglycolate phosphatase-like HAD superfamily hydrolase